MQCVEVKEIRQIHMGKAKCSVDLGDGSERGEYVNQDYILSTLGRPMRSISLMTCYYPLDEAFPKRAHNAFADQDVKFQWDYPYDDYETYKGGLVGLKDKEPFNWMRDVRSHGQDVCLTITMDTHISDEHLVAIAKDLAPFGRVLLRVNHEATGNWFSFNKRASYEEVAEFFAHVCDIFHKEAENVKLILCLDGYKSLDEEKMTMEDIFDRAIKNADIFSVDRYMALHWGWPYDVADSDTNNYSRSKVEEIYELGKRSFKRYCEIAGEKRPMVLSEANADGDVTGPYDQAKMLKDFCKLVKEDEDKWLDGFTLYQFRDRGRLGLEWEDPNNSENGIKLPLMDVFKEIINDEYFMPEMICEKESTIPAKLRWGGSEDADGVALKLHFDSNPVFCEAYFEDELEDANLMMEINGKWFYKKKGVKFIDFMPAFFEKPINEECDLNINIFAPPASGENDPTQGADWKMNYYFEMKALPKFRIQTVPVVK